MSETQGFMSMTPLSSLWKKGLALLRSQVDRAGEGSLSFCCNICGAPCHTPLATLQRETPSCQGCSSTVRQRSLIYILSRHFFGHSLPLSDFPIQNNLRGVGMSDWEVFAVPLSKHLGYTNTYYHQAPKLDILDIPDALIGKLDFLITSDVLEHVAPPVSRAFVNIRRLLKPGGILILTVPWVPEGETTEHFPDLLDYSIETLPSGSRVLNNRTAKGLTQHYSRLVFHGGAGETLEMRVFSKAGLLQELNDAGFINIHIQGDDHLPHGIHWSDPWSLPITAEAPS
jgi:hypothetical protein